MSIPGYIIVCAMMGVVTYIAVNFTMVTTFSDPRTVQGMYIHMT